MSISVRRAPVVVSGLLLTMFSPGIGANVGGPAGASAATPRFAKPANVSPAEDAEQTRSPDIVIPDLPVALNSA